ncbi:MAG: glycosyltransferase family 4 protein [Gammaproteobacteria bacterium]
MKVLIFNVTATFTPRGSENYCWELARYLNDSEHEVLLAAGAVEAPIIKYPQVPLRTFAFRPRERFPDLGSRFRRMAERISFGLHARRALVEWKPDIINIHKPYDLPFALWLRRRTGCRVVLRFHGVDFYWGLGRLLPRADAIFCVSDRARRMLTDVYPVACEVIHTGVDSAFYTRGTPAPAGEILYFGSLEGWKGVETLVRALDRIRDRDWRARIVGDGPTREALGALVTELGLDDRVRFKQAVHGREAVRGLLSGSAITVFPSLDNETFSNAVLEAMSMETTVLASDAGGFPEAITPGVNGLLFPPGDDAALASALKSVLSDPGHGTALARRAAADVRARFDARGSFARVLDLFRSVLDRRQA